MGKKQLDWKRSNSSPSTALTSTLRKFTQEAIKADESQYNEQLITVQPSVQHTVQLTEQSSVIHAVNLTNQVTDKSSVDISDTQLASNTDKPSVDILDIQSVNNMAIRTEISPVTTTEKLTQTHTVNNSNLLAIHEPSEWKLILDTHTEREQKVYSAMYEECLKFGNMVRYFTAQEIANLIGLKHRQNVLEILEKLIAKKNIAVISSGPGERFGKEYRVYNPKEIIERRNKSKLKIHPQTKKII